MSKGAVAKKYQPYRRLAEAQALEIAELKAEVAVWKGRALTFRAMYAAATSEDRQRMLDRLAEPWDPQP